jgi:hypothetical protein
MRIRMIRAGFAGIVLVEAALGISEAIAAGGVWLEASSNVDLVVSWLSPYAVAARLSDLYGRAPVLVVGLGALLVVPLLALGGLAMRGRGAPPPAAPGESIETTWPNEGWIEVEGNSESRRRIGHGMVRIGRQDDNDLCISHRTVHRYHAIVHHSPDAGFIITDLSGAEGNGIRVNGTRVEQAHLSHGDCVELGEVRLKFESAPD